MTLEFIMEQLKEGKRLELRDAYYQWPPVPVLYVRDEEGTVDTIDLDCVRYQERTEYMVEKQIKNLSSVSVEFYKEKQEKILYIFTNPQGTKMYARLENGAYVEYKLGILDLEKVVGVYTGIPSISEEDVRTVSLRELHNILGKSELPEDKIASVWEKLVKSAKG